MKRDGPHQGDTASFSRKVRAEDLATFESGLVHPLYSTFAVVRDAEWTCRQFVPGLAEPDEEGIGTFISVDHVAPVAEGAQVDFQAVIRNIHGHEIICDFTARCGETIIARGVQVQKILKKEKIARLISQASG
ncbi:MAG TPA: hypothetical protein VMV20_06740 [Chitinophagaceae bacterium]|nr:hypothetical protein [Chitinophagaceae bacterium]